MLVLGNGDAIRGKASNDAVIKYTVSGYVGTVATLLGKGLLGTSEADMALSSADATVVTSITLVNGHSSAVTVNVYLKSTTAYEITPVDLSLGIGYSLYTDGKNIIVMDAIGGVVTTTAAHDLGGSQHIADTLANLSGKVSDDTVCGIAATQELTNKTLNAPVAKGTWTSSSWGIPAGTLQGTLTLNGQAFDAGSGQAKITSTGLGGGLELLNTNTAATGGTLIFRHTSGSPADADVLGAIDFYGQNKDDENGDAELDKRYATLFVRSADITLDSEDATFEMYLENAGDLNQAFIVYGTGVVSGDEAYAQHDEYDDAKLMLRENRLQLCDIGVLSRKNTGSGYMLNFQPAIYLAWGGIKQNRAKIDNLERRLELLGG